MSEFQNWCREMPEYLRHALTSVPLMNELRRHRNATFQLIGSQDGSMSEACMQLFRDDYAALDEFVKFLETPRVK